MPRQMISADTIETAVGYIVPYLEDTTCAGHKAIYFDGTCGLAASPVLRAIAQDPPPSLLKKFDKIIHVDCSRWKSRRALQRTIAQELKLPRRVMDIFDRQDEEDDFRGIDESSRAEIGVVGREIHQVLAVHGCLVVFHNGSNDMVNLSDFGILQAEFLDTKVLWTFRGRLRLNPGLEEKVDDSHIFLYDVFSYNGWNYLLQIEAGEIAGYIDKLGEAVEECCLYLLSLNSQGGNIMDYNWATHASNYWVCDGIIQGGRGDEAWEAAAALHQHINMEDYSSNALPTFGDNLETPPKRWILAKDRSVVQPESTSFFLAAVGSKPDPPLRPLPNDMFQQSDKLRVLKLCRCTFSFSSPPFSRCHSLRFLGLDGCKDQGVEEDEKQDRPTMKLFLSLWVLDICDTDWELDLATYITEQMASNIREVHIKKGRIWCHNFSWGKLKNLQKLLVIEPTRPWQTGGKDEFTDTVKMEFLNLSGNTTLQVLPSLSKATSLKTLVLDACVGLEHLGPEALPPLLESFSLDVGGVEDHSKEAQIRCISMAGCARLSNFKLGGYLPNLEELDLSGTGVKTLDLTTQVVLAPCLQRVMLLGCEQLRAVLWPEMGMPQLSLLCIDTRGGEEVGRITPDSDKFKKGHWQAYVAMTNVKFIQILTETSNINMFWSMDTNKLSLNLCISSSGQWCNKDKMGSGNCGNILGPTLPKSLNPNQSYNDFAIDNITIDHGYNSAAQFQPASTCHVEIGEGISNTSMESRQGNKAIVFVMDRARSLHVHDNYSINTVIPECIMTIQDEKLGWVSLQQCLVERCPKLDTVFTTNYDIICFQELENLWAADLLMASCVWSRGKMVSLMDTSSFRKLHTIHLYSCPRLKFVLPLSWAAPGSYFPNLEILHIVSCGDLDKVFPVEPQFLATISTDDRKGVLEFPKLKHIYLHELYKLQQICEAKMFAPKLETVRVRGCWGLRRLPAVGQGIRPIVDCEKDWWEKLEWDGPEASHERSLYDPRHSSYYKKPLPRFSVLW